MIGMRPILYLDVDGVLFGLYDGAYQLRPRVNSILAQMVEHFEVRWLTSWSFPRLQQMLMLTQCTVSRRTTEQDWGSADKRKVDAIDMSQDFWWLEDEIGDDARCRLYDYNVLGRYIYCNPEGETSLQDAWDDLIKRALKAGSIMKIEPASNPG